jgi:hypothetical protein
MKQFALLASLLCAVAVAACGGGGASSASSLSERPSLAENSEAEAHRHEKQGQAHESARQERREEKENREFKEQEEARIRGEETAREKQQEKAAEDKHPEPKPEAVPELAPSEVDPIAAEEFHQFKGVDHENWELAYKVCGSTPKKQLAREFHTGDNWAAIGHAYGSEEFREPFNIAPEEGCMAALKDSGAMWEATLEALPFKEL